MKDVPPDCNYFRVKGDADEFQHIHPGTPPRCTQEWWDLAAIKLPSKFLIVVEKDDNTSSNKEGVLEELYCNADLGRSKRLANGEAIVLAIGGDAKGNVGPNLAIT